MNPIPLTRTTNAPDAMKNWPTYAMKCEAMKKNATCQQKKMLDYVQKKNERKIFRQENGIE